MHQNLQDIEVLTAKLANYRDQATRLLVSWQQLQRRRTNANKANYLIQLKKLLILTMIETTITEEKLPDDLPDLETMIEELLRTIATTPEII